MPELKRLFGTDTRSLAAFRIGLAVMILADLFQRSADLAVHYSDAGVIPRIDQIRLASGWHLSFHLMSGLPFVQGLLFAAAAAFAVLLLAGYKTRLMTFLSWIFLISLQSRNQPILQSSDTLLRMMLFWSLFVPLGAHWSMDRRLKRSHAQPSTEHLSAGSFALCAQVVIVYWFTVMHKWGPIWGSEASAVYYAMSLEHYTKPPGIWLLNFPVLMAFLTRFVYAFEIAGPLLLFSPFRFVSLRLIAIGGFVLMQLGFGMFIELGLYPLLAITAMLPFLPGPFWDDRRVAGVALRLEARVSGALNSAQALWTQAEARLSPLFRLLFLKVIPVFFLVYVLLWNAALLPGAPLRFTAGWTRVAHLFRVDQKWNMFSPATPLDGWFVIEGRLADGRIVDLYRGGEPISWEKPAVVSRTHKNQRWRKYMINLRRKNGTMYRAPYARYLCRQWNSQHSGAERLGAVEILFMLEKTLPGNRTEKVQKISLIRQACT